MAVTNSKNSVLSGRIESVLSMKITQALLDSLTAQAKASPRLRMYHDSLCPSIGTGNPPKRWFV